MKKVTIILTLLIVIFTGCNIMDNNENLSEDIGYKKISAEEAKAIIDSEEVIILDVRTLEEYNSGHIEDALLLPVNNVRDMADEILTDTNAKILVYCRSGNRSAVATNDLVKLGYTNVYDFGGINSWPYEIVK